MDSAPRRIGNGMGGQKSGAGTFTARRPDPFGRWSVRNSFDGISK